MKITTSCLFFFSSLFLTLSAWAGIPSMHLNWTLSDTSGITQYKLYYSTNSDMSAKIWHTECGNPTEEPLGTFSMTCTNIPINSFPAYIQVAAKLADNSEITSNPQKIAEDPADTLSPPITIVQNFQLFTSTVTPPPPDGTLFYWSLNTLPTTTTTSEVGNVTITKHQNDGTSAAGIIGNCLEQTGTWQAYRFPMTIMPTNKGKISFWAKHSNPPDSGNATTRYFFKSSNTDQANTLYAYTYKNNIYFYLNDSAGVLHRTYKAEDTWNTGTWYQYEFMWDGDSGSMAIKRNSAIVSEINTTPWSNSTPVWGTQDFYIGSADPLGSMDEFYISNN
jgi:hypothetical protein